MHRLLAFAVGTQSGVDVFGKHVAVHLVLAKKWCFPVSIAAAKEPEAKHPAAAWVRDGVDLVELDGDHLGVEAFVGVVDDAASLDNVDGLVCEESLSCPSRVVRMRAVVAVKDSNNIGIRTEIEEVVEVVGLGLGAWNLDDPEVLVLLWQKSKLALQGLDRLGGVVDQVDPKLLLGVDKLLTSIQDLIPNDVLLVGQVGDDNHVNDWQVLYLAIEIAWKLATVGFNFHCCFASISNWRQAEE